MAVDSVTANKEADFVKYPLAIALLMASLLSPAFGVIGYAQGSKGARHLPDTTDGLQLSAEIIGDKKKFRRTDSFSIRVKLKNVGRSPITLYKNMAGAGRPASSWESLTAEAGG